MAYYYLVASLIPLTLEGDVSFTPREFFESCKNMLASQDRKDLEYVIDGRPESARHAFVRKWLSAENQLKNALAAARSARLNIDSHQFLRGDKKIDINAAKIVAEALSKHNPLDKERALDKYRWKLLDDMARADFFGMSSIFSYVIKLKLIMRWKSLNDEKGREVLEKLIVTNSGEICYGM
ncbi:DUF2764 family protein [uncultured Candidatus Kuenenia sp.]|uniref:DUF2764 family protein n=1 Tax=uncultured Candidatus Kuenenia sp. TaxID=1048336 RepID=UPI0002D4BB5E|nr:DUF2764 family protein [uncultured Candidatus Kuenenia sp.]